MCVCVCVCAYPWRDVREIDGINKVEHIVAQESLVLYRAITHYCFAHIPQTGVCSVYGLCDWCIQCVRVVREICDCHSTYVCVCDTRTSDWSIQCVHSVCEIYFFFWSTDVRACVCVLVCRCKHTLLLRAHASDWCMQCVRVVRLIYVINKMKHIVAQERGWLRLVGSLKL